jgi:hypothetical protein
VKRKKMNTKILVALVIGIALFGLTGGASACETVNEDLYYQFVKIVEGQTGTNVNYANVMDVTKSGAFFEEKPSNGCTPDCDNAGIINKLNEAKVSLTTGNSEYTGTLTQRGWATVIKRPHSSVDGSLPEVEASTLATQELTTTGPQTYAKAKFDSEAYAGTSGYDPVTGYPGSPGELGNIYAKAGLRSPAVTGVTAGTTGAQFGSATMGMSLSTSLAADPDVDHTNVLMSGGSSAYSRFSDAKLDEQYGVISTYSTINACHEWGDHYGGYGSGLNTNVDIDCDLSP